MKILFLNTTESVGGAAIAAKRLKAALRKRGIDVKLLVRSRDSNDVTVDSLNKNIICKTLIFFRFLWERISILFNNNFDKSKLFKVSLANTGASVKNMDWVKDADIIHLHWINQGFLSLNDIKELIDLGKPIIWTMHDMWPLTSICHYSWDCERYQERCGRCPFLNSTREYDISYTVFAKKKQIYSSVIHFVSVSNWLCDRSKMSPLTKDCSITVIPNTIDQLIFYPKAKDILRKRHQLSIDKKVILMGAARLDDPIKGLDDLIAALRLMSESKTNLHLLLFGAIKDCSILDQIPIPFSYLGPINDLSLLADLYSCADVTVVPSRYETFGQTLIESMACACPVVSYNNSGQNDIIEHKYNGYLARYRDIEDLANGLLWSINNDDPDRLGMNALQSVSEKYTENIIAEKYMELYKKVLNSSCV